MNCSAIVSVFFLSFFASNSQGAEISYRSGIALAKSLESTYRHKYEIVEVGELFLNSKDLFGDSIGKMEWAVLQRHLLNYLRIHDDPKTWERERLIEFGYPEDLPTIKAFLAKSHGTSFQNLPENDIAHAVKRALNSTEERFKKKWAQTQNITDEIFKTLMFWEHYIDILATRLSVERAKELSFKYELYSGTEWLLRLHSRDYSEQLKDRVGFLKDFEKKYFDFVSETRCVFHLANVEN